VAVSNHGDPDGGPRRSGYRWTAVVIFVVLGGVLLFGLVTSMTGFPGPGALRRYQSAELAALERKINASVAAAAARNCGSPRVRASVNPLASRVEVSGGYGTFPPLSDTERAMITTAPDARFSEASCEHR
jgi:hypothetical protein